MDATYQTDLSGLIDDLYDLLEHDSNTFIHRFESEISPTEIEFIFKSPSSGTSPSKSENLHQSPAQKKTRSSINALCAECNDRIFPIKKFRRHGSGKILVMYYNGPISDDISIPDRSEQFIFGRPEADDLFQRLIVAAGFSFEQIHFQEYPGCFFNPARSSPEDWNDRCGKCLHHVAALVEQQSIQLLVLLGTAAIFLLGEEKARELQTQGSSIVLPLGERSVKAIVLRSPAAFLALERKRKRLAGEEDQKAKIEFQKVVSEEKSIKRSALKALKHALADSHT